MRQGVNASVVSYRGKVPFVRDATLIGQSFQARSEKGLRDMTLHPEGNVSESLSELVSVP